MAFAKRNNALTGKVMVGVLCSLCRYVLGKKRELSVFKQYFNHSDVPPVDMCPLFCAISFALYLLVASSRKQSSGGVEFRRFQRLYITVYLVAQGSIT